MSAVNQHAISTALGARQIEWLREFYHITPRELRESPTAVQEDIMAHWNRWWRNECQCGRGLKLVVVNQQQKVA